MSNNVETQILPITTPTIGEIITSLTTGNTYEMGENIGEGNFGIVYACKDTWDNNLAAKVLKPISSYEKIKASAEAEFHKLIILRNPYITFVHDAFEFRNTFYIVTERCVSSIAALFSLPNFDGKLWLLPIARCLLQAVHYLHVNGYVHQDIHPGNVFTSIVKDEMIPDQKDALQFKLGDLGVTKLLHEVDAANTRANWMLPPEVIEPTKFGVIDHRVDIYHLGLLFLQLAYSQELYFSQEETIQGKPRSMALNLSPPFNFALEKALRRHVEYRTEDATELWRDLRSPIE